MNYSQNKEIFSAIYESGFQKGQELIIDLLDFHKVELPSIFREQLSENKNQFAGNLPFYEELLFNNFRVERQQRRQNIFLESKSIQILKLVQIKEDREVYLTQDFTSKTVKRVFGKAKVRYGIKKLGAQYHRSFDPKDLSCDYTPNPNPHHLLLTNNQNKKKFIWIPKKKNKKKENKDKLHCFQNLKLYQRRNQVLSHQPEKKISKRFSVCFKEFKRLYLQYPKIHEK